MRRIIPILFFLFLALIPRVHAAQPIDVLRVAVDKVLTILEDPAYQEPSQKEAQQERIWDTIQDIFDFEEMSRSTVARNWKIFTTQEKKEFTDVFGRFLGANYLGKIC